MKKVFIAVAALLIIASSTSFAQTEPAKPAKKTEKAKAPSDSTKTKKPKSKPADKKPAA